MWHWFVNCRSATASYISVDTAFGIDAQKGISNGSSVSDDLYTALSNVDDIDVNYLNETKDNFTGFYLCFFLYITLFCHTTRKKNNKK